MTGLIVFFLACFGAVHVIYYAISLVLKAMERSMDRFFDKLHSE